MKNKKTKIIIIAAIVVVIAAVAIVIGLGVNEGWFSGSKEPTVSQVYDSSGNYVVREEYYDKKGNLEYKVVKGYGDLEKKKLTRETYMTPEDKIIKVVNYNEGGVVSGVDEYDGARISVHREYVNGEETGKYFKYEYTEDGVILNSTEYDAKDQVVKIVKREYNSNGDITLYLEQGKDGNQIAKTVYEYNAEGKECKVIFYDGEGVTGHIEYEYDKDGNRVKMSEYIKGELSSYRTYTYDENGVAQEKYYSATEQH